MTLIILALCILCLVDYSNFPNLLTYILKLFLNNELTSKLKLLPGLKGTESTDSHGDMFEPVNDVGNCSDVLRQVMRKFTG